MMAKKQLLKLLPDEVYLKLLYYKKFRKKLDLKSPKTFNEKLQWLKLNDRKKEYAAMVDKYAAKQWIAERIGAEYVVPTFGVWKHFDDIDFDQLPNQFVLKCTHDSASYVLVKDKAHFDREAAKARLESHLKQNFYWSGREWAYKNVPPQIIAEEYLVDESGVELKDYKIFCFNGVPKYVEVDFGRAVLHKLNTYDFDWNPLHFCDQSKSDYEADIKKPAHLDEMRKIAATLAKDMKFLRVDFYSIYDRIYVGELTLYPGSGIIAFDPPETDLRLGELLDLEAH